MWSSCRSGGRGTRRRGCKAGIPTHGITSLETIKTHCCFLTRDQLGTLSSSSHPVGFQRLIITTWTPPRHLKAPGLSPLQVTEAGARALGRAQAESSFPDVAWGHPACPWADLPHSRQGQNRGGKRGGSCLQAQRNCRGPVAPLLREVPQGLIRQRFRSRFAT